MTVNAKADGLKICVFRPPLSHTRKAFAVNATPSMTNCHANHSSLNHRNRFMLNTMGNGPKPNVYTSRRDHVSNMSNAYAKMICAAIR